MPDFKLPLSGNVTQAILPWTSYFNPVGSQIGLINVNLDTSSNPAVEDQVLRMSPATGTTGAHRGRAPAPAAENL